MEIGLPTLNKTKRSELAILILCLLIGFALRFYTFDQKSLWLDEIHTFNESRDDLKGQLKFYKEYPTHLQPSLLSVYKTRKRSQNHSPHFWNPLHSHDLFFVENVFPHDRTALYPIFNLHGLSYQPFTRRSLLCSFNVSWNAKSFSFHELYESGKTWISHFSFLFMGYHDFDELQCYFICRFCSNFMVLSIKSGY
jgi:hypothetical protein